VVIEHVQLKYLSLFNQKFDFMKKYLSLLAFVLFFNTLQAQIYPQGSIRISAGYGAVTYGNIALKVLENQLKITNLNLTPFGPLYLKGEYAVANNFTVGLNVNYYTASSTFTLDSIKYVGKYSGTFKLNSTSIIARANYTIPFAEDRAGIMLGGGLGYRAFKPSYSDDNPQTPLDGGISIPIPFTVELTVGLHYYLTDNIGVYVESGLTRSLFQGGITARFGGAAQKD
jgi:hypothetical protein